MDQTKREIVQCALILLVASGLRFVSLASQNLWLDEYTTLEVSQRTIVEILNGVGFDRHTPPFYYILMHFWLGIFPGDEFWLRTPATICDLVNVLLLFRVAQHVFGEGRGSYCALLYALNPFAIYYAQEARMYSLVISLVLGTLILLLRLAMREWSIRERLLFIVLSIAGCYTHYYFCLYLAAATLVVAVVLWGESKRLRSFGLTLVVVGLAYLPWIGVILSLASSGGQSFRQHFWFVIPYTAFRFIFGYAIVPITYGYKEHAIDFVISRWWVFAPAFCLVVLATIKGSRRARFRTTADYLLVAILPCLLLSLALLIGLKVPMLSERYLSILLPFFLLIIACGSELFLVKVLIPFFFLIGCIAYEMNDAYGKAEWRAVAKAINEQRVNGEYIAVSPAYLSGLLRYYLTREGSVVTKVSYSHFPSKSIDLLQFQEQLPAGFKHGDGEIEGGRSSLIERIWLVESADTKLAEEEFTASNFSRAARKIFPKENGIVLSLFIGDPGRRQ